MVMSYLKVNKGDSLPNEKYWRFLTNKKSVQKNENVHEKTRLFHAVSNTGSQWVNTSRTSKRSSRWATQKSKNEYEAGGLRKKPLD